MPRIINIIMQLVRNAAAEIMPRKIYEIHIIIV